MVISDAGVARFVSNMLQHVPPGELILQQSVANCSRFANHHQPILEQPPLRSALVIGNCRSALSAGAPEDEGNDD